MVSDATIAAIRFGYGPARAGAGGPEALLAGLGAPDRMRARHPGPSSADAIAWARAYGATRNGDDDAARRDLRHRALRSYGDGLSAAFARILDTDTPLRERLTWFWADHFTAAATTPIGRVLAPAFVDEAIRPHVTGRFGEMLVAAVTHPQMLLYLDQIASVGPNSPAGRRSGRGLNENLAREVLELHTLGVDGPYGQDDVRQLAELMTGLSASREEGFRFRPGIAEPGAEEVLGKSYGGARRARLEEVTAALEDLAVHPATARHVSSKLAVHFLSDRPDPGLIDAMTGVWLETGGDLRAVLGALLAHPSAWSAQFEKARQPFEFMAAALLAFGITGEELMALPFRERARSLARPLRMLGQPWLGAPGPDGWPEETARWITPQGLAARIVWAAEAARRLEDRVGEPVAFVERALADAASDRLLWAVTAAETRADAIALTLASAEFNRR